jgi:hypothetical protein
MIASVTWTGDHAVKVTITADCTPEEARTFLGLPDFSAVQQQIAAAMQDQFRRQMSADPETAMKAWFGPALQGLTGMQQDYWQQMFKPPEPKSG